MNNSLYQKVWLLILPAVAWFYIGLFITIQLWYPRGMTERLLADHVVSFSLIYIARVIVFFVYTLFDVPTFRNSSTIISRLLIAMATNAVIATAYFYFQPELILTPRRFLLVHVLVTTIGLALWYAMIQYFLPRVWQRKLFLHPALYGQNLNTEIESYLATNPPAGWQFEGQFSASNVVQHNKSTIVLPDSPSMNSQQLQELFKYKRLGMEFMEYYKFIELTQRMVPLSKVSEIWFLRSVSYSKHYLFDTTKRLIDILIGLVGTAIFLLLLPVIGLAIKLDSKGSVFFTQLRVGRYGQPFRLYKFRSMSGGATDTWTSDHDQRITKVGSVLRKLRLDELPQFWNILRGNMSLVGPRPEQLHIVESLKEQIPYYDERHIVKPGLTGWGQLHVYANSLEDTKLKLQYDFYYIKHRSLWFDIEIVLRTIFHILALQGK